VYARGISFDLYLFLSANSLIKEMCGNQSGESFLCGLDNGAYNSVTKTGNCLSVGLGIISCWVGEWGLGLAVAIVNCWNVSLVFFSTKNCN